MTDLNAIYGNVISPDAKVSVPPQWMPAVHCAMQALHDLPTDIRAFLIVVGIVEDRAELAFQIIAQTALIGDAGMQQLYAIIDEAQAAAKAGVH